MLSGKVYNIFFRITAKVTSALKISINRLYIYHLRISSFVALRDLDGLPGASSLPYFFLLLVIPLVVPFSEPLSFSLVKELWFCWTLVELLELELCCFVVLDELDWCVDDEAKRLELDAWLYEDLRTTTSGGGLMGCSIYLRSVCPWVVKNKLHYYTNTQNRSKL